MVVKVIGSSSKGNCYILENNEESLVIELGVNFNTIKSNVDLSKVVGALVTHEHGDHCKCFADYVKSGFIIYSSPGTNYFLKEKLKDENLYRFFFDLPKYDVTWIGGFGVYPFDAKHDVKEPLSFLIYHKDIGNVLFVTDTRVVTSVFDDVEVAIIEANYDTETIESRVNSGRTPSFLRDRIMNSHLGLDNALFYLENMPRDKLRKVVLIHLSDGHSNAELMKRIVIKRLAVPVYVADKNMIIDL